MLSVGFGSTRDNRSPKFGIGNTLVAKILFGRLIPLETQCRAISEAELAFQRRLRIGLTRKFHSRFTDDRFDFRTSLPLT